MTTLSVHPVVAATPTPSGAAFDLVLLAHILAVLVSVGTVAASGVQALRLAWWRRETESRELPENLARYYAPGINWAGRCLHLVPLLGLALVAMSRRAYGFEDLWVQIGLGLWVTGALLAEGVIWPDERLLQRQLGGKEEVGRGQRPERRIVLAAGVVEVLLVVGSVVMVAKP